MKKIFDYCCKKCWYTWRDKRDFIQCPKCKSRDIDRKDDILLADE